MFWMKHITLATRFCYGADRSGTFVTNCNGRWGSHDPDFARADDPPHEQRCEACERVRIEQRRINIGLAELATNTAQEYPGVHELFDVGGEG